MTSAPENDVNEQAEAAVPASNEAPDPQIEDTGDEDSAAGDEGEQELSVLEALEAKVEELEKDKKDTYERLLRATADLDNFRKRSRREIEDARVEARARALREILPVIDNLERAMTHADGSGEGVIEGVKLVMRQFEQALVKCDVKLVEAKDKPFDPNFHEAMSQIPSADVEPGTVVAVLQNGYTIGERLLRPALVVVAKAPPSEEQPAGANGKSAKAGGDDGDSEAEQSSEGEES